MEATQYQKEYHHYQMRAEASGEPPMMFRDFMAAMRDYEANYAALWLRLQHGDESAWDGILEIERRLCL